MKIYAVDVDGVVADLATAWLNRYNKDYNDHVTPANILSWDMHLYVKPECGTKLYDYIEDPTLYDEVLPTDGALEGIKILSSVFRVIFVTNSTIGASGAKYNWLLKQGFLSRLDDYIECKDKSLVKADLLLDDRLKNLLDFSGTGILYTQPWNIGLHWYGSRMKGWRYFIETAKLGYLLA